MSRFGAFPTEYDDNAGRRRTPVFSPVQRRGSSYPVSPQHIAEDPYYQPSATMNQSEQQPGGYFALQNARSDNQRQATIGINAAKGSPAAAALLQKSQSTPVPSIAGGSPKEKLQGMSSAAAADRERGRLYGRLMSQGYPDEEAWTHAQRAFPQSGSSLPATVAAPTTQPAAGAKQGALPTPAQPAQPAQTGAAQFPMKPGVPSMAQGGNAPQMSEQIARSMFWNTAKGDPQQFHQLMQKWGVDGHALLNKWAQDGTLNQQQFPTGQFQQAPSRTDLPLNPQTGGGGVITKPNGEQVVLAQTPGGNYGRQVGGPIAQGPPLPPVPVMSNVQQGFTPAPMMPQVNTPPRPQIDSRAAAALAPPAPSTQPSAAQPQGYFGGSPHEMMAQGYGGYGHNSQPPPQPSAPQSGGNEVASAKDGQRFFSKSQNRYFVKRNGQVVPE